MAKQEIKLLKYKEDNNTQDVHSSLTQVSQTPKEIIPYTCSRKRKQAPSNNIGKEFKTDALKRAEEIQANLDPKFPSLVKYMMPSHVSGCFWLGLPFAFCKSYMPKQDETMMLKTEDVRQNGLAEVDGAPSLLGLDSRVEQTDPGKIIKANRVYQKQCARSLPRAILQDSNRSPILAVSGLELALPIETASSFCDKIYSAVELGMEFLPSIEELKQDFKDVENFSITVNGLNIDTQIPTSVKTKYYELCRSQNAFLHEYLPKVINNKLVAGIISETVNIADAIVVSNLTTSQKEFLVWDKSLLAFQKLGMNVDFLRSRLQRLMGLAQATDVKKYKETVLGKSQVEEEIKTTELKLVELRKASRRFGAEIEGLKVKVERHEQKFRERLRHSGECSP